jgi:hypothetical protein
MSDVKYQVSRLRWQGVIFMISKGWWFVVFAVNMVRRQ